MSMYNLSPSCVKHRLDREKYGDNRRREYSDSGREQAPTIVVNVPPSVVLKAKQEDKAANELMERTITAMQELTSAINKLLNG